MASEAPTTQTTDSVADSTHSSKYRSLTESQTRAAGSTTAKLFIEAGPGSGKTTVAAHRFGALRYAPASAYEHRAVAAVSFTRAATYELRRRVRSLWGPTALQWPHRIVTLDTVIYELVHFLLQERILHWPNGHVALKVEDSWKVLTSTFYQRGIYGMEISGGSVLVKTGFARKAAQRVEPRFVKRMIEAGTCTHEDVRDVLELALSSPAVREAVRARFNSSMRGLIVDEIFDANNLDIDVIELAIEAGVSVSVVGDPWQALYVFRGARPEDIPALAARTSMSRVVLEDSFRWLSASQRDLADGLRSGRGVSLERSDDGGISAKIDVALGVLWKDIWDVGAHVLPLAFHAPKGSSEEAAATILLNHVVRGVMGEDATYLGDALTTLAISDPDIPRQLEPSLQEILDTLRQPGAKSANHAYNQLKATIQAVSPREMRPVHGAYTKRLKQIRSRILHEQRPVLGLTIHQAKGREWGVVGLRISQAARDALRSGLDVHEDLHRKLYVACTRARERTVEV
ncbi:UvrD-helicase domain-containing protein [Pseudonocardia sp. WMMC193]|nr:UvrD-helicase domain-containing protein [Pseudonocardia sp. WMMC193]